MKKTEKLATLVVDDTVYETRLTRKFSERKPYRPADPRQIRAFIPGVVRAIHVHEGRPVERGAPLLVLEAMKMSNDVTSSTEGIVARIHVRVGDMVTMGQLLLELD